MGLLYVGGLLYSLLAVSRWSSPRCSVLELLPHLLATLPLFPSSRLVCIFSLIHRHPPLPTHFPSSPPRRWTGRTGRREKASFSNTNMKVVCPYSDCLKAFTSDFNLQRHLRGSHLKERPFQCPDCFQSFGYRHVLIHHSAKKHPTIDFGPLPPKIDRPSQSITIPKLTSLNQGLSDPDIGCFVHINFVYMFPVVEEDMEIPPVSEFRKQSTALPRLSDALTRKRRRITPQIID